VAGKQFALSGISDIREDERMANVTQQIFEVIEARKINAPEGSYTAKLFAAGEVEVLKKIGEEAVEVVVAASKQSEDRIVYEVADLVYHSLVLLSMRNLTWHEVEEELARRMK
jgi:phosphoribosyl-ATP pyrophosphohydrolase